MWGVLSRNDARNDTSQFFGSPDADDVKVCSSIARQDNILDGMLIMRGRGKQRYWHSVHLQMYL